MNLFSRGCFGHGTKKKVVYTILLYCTVCLWFPPPNPYPHPPTLSVLWSIRLSVHSQKWLWHLLKRPVECSGLKGYPTLWPKTTRFFLFSLSFPSKTPLWHCVLACWLLDQSLNTFKLPPMKHTPHHHHYPSSHIQTYRHPDMTTHTGIFMHTNITLRCKTHTKRNNTKRTQCEITTSAVLHFQWGFNILWAHQRQDSWGESTSGEFLFLTPKQSQTLSSINVTNNDTK